MKPPTPATGSNVPAISVPKSAVENPIFTIKGLTPIKGHVQSSTASNNRTIAAMLSTSAQSLGQCIVLHTFISGLNYHFLGAKFQHLYSFSSKICQIPRPFIYMS
jgi:hypothetical protein